jgi:integrase/recombinase XerD
MTRIKKYSGGLELHSAHHQDMMGIVTGWLGQFSPPTAESYRISVDQWARSVSTDLPGLAAACVTAPIGKYRNEVAAWSNKIRAGQLATNTKKRKVVALRSWIDWIADYREDSAKPRVRPIKTKGKRTHVQVRGDYVDRVEAVIRDLSSHDLYADMRLRALAMLLLMYDSGLRVGSVLSIRVKDFSWSEKTVNARMKMRSNREKRPISKRTAEALYSIICERQLGPHDYLFHSRHAIPPFPPLSRRAAIEIVADLGLGTPHKLRHAAATRLADETGDVFLVRDFLAHSDISTASVYVDRSTERAKTGTALVSGESQGKK